MAVRHRSGAELVQDRSYRWCHSSEFLHVLRREPADALTSLGGELDPHHAQIDVVDTAPHQARRLGAVDELDDAVMAYEQLGGQVADRGLLRFRSTPYGEKKLVLRGSNPDFCCALLCPPEVST